MARLNFTERVRQIHVALEQHAISHAFGGAIALIYAVEHPRLTYDIDLNIAVETARVESVLRALPADLPWSEADKDSVARDGQVRLHWGENLPVDLFFPQHEFHRVVAARTRIVTFDREPLPVISPTDLTVFKSLFNRTKDWADIEAMLEAGSVDTADALSWLRVIVGVDHPSFESLTLAVERFNRHEDGARGDPNVWKR